MKLSAFDEAAVYSSEALYRKKNELIEFLRRVERMTEGTTDYAGENHGTDSPGSYVKAYGREESDMG